MIKVIKPGRKPEPEPLRVTCPHCEAVLEYTEMDLRSHGTRAAAHQGRYPDEYIVCPECAGSIVMRESRPCVGRWPSAF